MVFHNEDGNPARANIKQALGYLKDGDGDGNSQHLRYQIEKCTFKERYNTDIRATNILLQGLPKDIYTLINHYTDAKDIWDNVKMLLEVVKLNRGLRDSNYDQLYTYLKQHKAHANENKMMLDRFTQHTVDPLALMSNNRGQGNNAQGAGAASYGGAHNRVGNANPGQNSEYFKDKMLLMQAQENRVALDEEQLLFLAGGQDNAVDEDVDEQPV
ncbi:hypothetical protein Tco_0105193 [Tanacetum coccineum]